MDSFVEKLRAHSNYPRLRRGIDRLRLFAGILVVIALGLLYNSYRTGEWAFTAASWNLVITALVFVAARPIVHMVVDMADVRLELVKREMLRDIEPKPTGQ